MRGYRSKLTRICFNNLAKNKADGHNRFLFKVYRYNFMKRLNVKT